MTTVDGKKQFFVTDHKGRRIDFYPQFDVQKDMGREKAIQRE